MGERDRQNNLEGKGRVTNMGVINRNIAGEGVSLFLE